MSKKWCQYCRVNIDYNRQAIRKHQDSRLHQQNKQRQINHERRKARKEHKNTHNITIQTKKSQGQQKKPIPKISQSQEKREMYNKLKAQVMDGIKSKIHTFIAQKTKGQFGANIEYPQQPLLTTNKYNEENISDQQQNLEDLDSENEEDDLKMWRIDICSDTKKPCFINNITGAKLYEKPAGLILTEQETNRWDQLQKQCDQQVQQQEVKIGEWQEVKEQEDIFVANAVKENSEQNSDSQGCLSQDLVQDIEQLRKELLNSNNITDQSRMMKKMIQTGREQVYHMDDFNSQANKMKETNKEKQTMAKEDDDLKKMKGFLPRKRVKGLTILGGQEFE